MTVAGFPFILLLRRTPKISLVRLAAAALEGLVNRKMAFEDEVPAVLDPGDGVETRQARFAALFL
jgi:hypothetical protein